MDLFFRELGKGNTITILHGLYGMSDNWLTIARMLANQYRVIIPDLRNHGHSPHSNTHTYEEMAQDVIKLLDKLNITQCLLIGHSMGGKIAMTIAKYFPSYVAGLGIVDIAPKNYDIKDTQDELSHQLIINSLMSLDIKNITRREEADKKLSTTIHSSSLRSFLLKNLSRDEEGNFKWLFNLPVLQQYLETIAGSFDYPWTLKIINQFPVLFIKGANSNYILPSDYPLIYEYFPEASIISISDTGHWLHAQKPFEFIEVVHKNLLSRVFIH